MPGAPDPVLGSDALTAGVAAGIGALVAALPYTLREALRARRSLALAGGLAYAALCLGIWAAARFVTGSFAGSLFEDPALFVVLLAAGTIVLGLQAAVPFYLLARWGALAPLAGLFGLTALVTYLFFHVRGESDPLGLYALVFGPPLVVGLAAVGLAEVGARRLVGRDAG